MAKEFITFPEDQIKAIHSPFYPEDIREGSGIDAFIQDPTSLEWNKTKVWRFSPLGVELLITNDQREFKKIKKDSVVNIRVRLKDQLSDFVGVLILTDTLIEKGRLIGVRWCHDVSNEKTKYDGFDRRSAKRFLCHEQFLPTGMATNPVKFNDFIAFRICDISKNSIGLMTSLRNKFIVKGMTLKSQVSFPTIGNYQVDFNVKNCRIVESEDGGDSYLWIGAEIENESKLLNQAIGDYLFQFGNEVSISELREEGLKVKKASQALEFGWVRTKEDYYDVIALRRSSYEAAGKLTEDDPDLEDIFDARARIITARHRGKLVGSMRLIFHEMNDSLEHERFFNYNQFDFLPRKDEVVEVTRICTHPDYRGSDILYSLMKQMTVQAVQAGRMWIIGSAEENLLKVYNSMGYYTKDIRFAHEDLGNIPHQLLLGHLPSMIAGKNVSASVWNELYKDVSEYFDYKDLPEDDSMVNIRQNLFKAISPITKLFSSGIRYPRFKKT